MHVAMAALILLGAFAYAAGQAPPAPPAQPAAASFVGILDEHPAIQYAQRPTRDRVALLNESIARGTASLAHQGPAGSLQSVLNALEVPAESQLLVFSKTGVQRAVTGPQNPRAIYFNDSVVVGYIPGARLLEIAAHDPQQGVVFYTIDQTVGSLAPVQRRTTCLACHVSGSTLEVPGMITRSMFTNIDGEALPQLGSFVVDHRTPLAQRWGGFYVTGNYVSPPYDGIGHMGNVTTAIHPISGPAATSNEVMIRWLNSPLDGLGYPSHDSDIAALMVFDHQMHAINLLTRINWESRVAAANGRDNFDSGIVRELVDELTDYFLFVDEVAPPARLTPRQGFAERFTAAGPKDRRGRSLRQLDLERRLLLYPCSYMVYSEAFDALPTATRDAIYRRMWTILSGADASRKYAHLSVADRRAIVEILRATKLDLPAVWNALASVENEDVRTMH
jgi:hypothetical protein